MHLVLTLPGLLAQAADRGVRAPRVASLVAIAGQFVLEPDGPDAMLAAHYGVAHAPNVDCPLAPLRLAALGIDPGAAFWLAADPVTLVAGRDDVRLAGVVHDLDMNEAATLIAMLNAHFATDGIVFVAGRPDAWFVRCPAPVALRTRPVAAVTGRMLRDLLPTGAEAGTWRRWQNEIQMLLHEHPVNAARERDGKAIANSVWFSEGGARATPERTARSIRTFADGGIATALAVHSDLPARPVPDGLGAALADAEDAALIVIALAAPVALEAVERAWAAPAWAALMKGRLDAVTLIADDIESALGWTARRPGFGRRTALRFAHHDLESLLAAARLDA